MAGYSGTPLVTKLGIKAGFKIHVVNAPDHYRDLIDPLPEDVTVASRLNDARGYRADFCVVGFVVGFVVGLARGSTE